jgi:peptidoglycan/xylan/chitin deacetylase (PgdA/CDA1 family)
MFVGVIGQSYGSSLSCHCVAFRLDDIQNYYLNNAQIEAIDTFQKKNASLTIGVIGNYFGDDPKLLDYVKQRVEQNNPKIEIANHGWNHENFALYNKTEQYTLLLKTNEKTLAFLSITPSGFLTPYNTLNNDTFLALQENNLKYISANKTQDPPPYPLTNVPFYRLPALALTGNLNDNDTAWITSTHNQTYAQILGSILNYGFAVVMMHPMDYTIHDKLNYTNEVDWNQIHQLELLIDDVRNDGFRIVTIDEIPENLNVQQKVPAWVSTIFDWYEEEKISAEEVINAIHYLNEKKIIT